MTAEKKFWAITAVCAVLFAYGVYNLFKPDIPPLSFVRGIVREIAPGVLIGPYPSENEMYRLKAMGVTTVISLMDPESKVETLLVAEGKERAEDYSMVYYNFPINVMSMEGEEGLASVREAIERARPGADSKVYVHCYLGRHRVSLFEREFLKARAQGDGAAPGLKGAQAGAGR